MLAADYQTGKTFALAEKNGRRRLGAPRRGVATHFAGPGLFDLQCNGFAGVDFNDPDASPERIAEAIRAMRAHGCTHVLPTLVTHTPDRLEHLFRQLGRALSLDREVSRAVPGFHLEGPFISPVEGARGAHRESAVIPVDRKVWQRLQRAAEGRIVLVTLAPEVKGALPFIRQLRAEHVLPALGHTMATTAQVAAAVEAGALVSTHLGNGCPQQMHRHANPMLAQLGAPGIAATFIPDGIHLPPEVLRAFAAAKGTAHTLLVTDAMAAAGAPPGRYRLADLELEVGTDRVVRFPGAANFAGSALTMDEAVFNYQRMAGVPLAEAWQAASLLPWRLLRQAAPHLRPPRENLVVLPRPAE